MGRVRLEELRFQDLTAGGQKEEGHEAWPAPLQCEQPKLDGSPLCMHASHKKKKSMGLTKRSDAFISICKGEEKRLIGSRTEKLVSASSTSLFPFLFFSLPPARFSLSFCLVSEKTILLACVE